MALERAGIGEGALLPHEILVDGQTDPDAASPPTCARSTASTARSPRAARIGTATAARSSKLSRWPTAARTRATHARRSPRRCPCSRAGRPRWRRASRRTSDFIDAVYGSFPLMIALIAITTFILLARAFRSLLLPLKAIVLNVLSVAAAWGVLVLVWQQGHGSSADLGHPRDRLDPLLDAADDLRLPVRALHGLRGLHPLPHAGGVRPHRLDQDRGDHAASDAPGAWSPARR